MDVISVKISGIRNITGAEITFDKMTALVGLNGYGKSNLLDAIDFGIDFIQCSPQQKSRMMLSKRDIPLLKSKAGMDYKFEIELFVESNGKPYQVIYGYSFSWGTSKSEPAIIGEMLKYKVNEKGQKYNLLINRDKGTARYKRAETGRCDCSVRIDSQSLVVNKLTAFDDLFYIDIIHQVNNIQFFIEHHLDAGPSYSPDLIVFKDFKELELGGIHNIPRTIFYLKKEYHDKYELLINSFIQLFPGIVDIKVEEIELNIDKKPELAADAPFMYTDSVYSLTVTDNLLVQPIRFEALSDGAKRIFLMLTYTIIADIMGLQIIAIEEPENSIHPGLLQNYMDILSQLVNKCKIVFTSHSPYIIQYIDARSIYIGINHNDGSVNFKRIAQSKVNSLMKDAMQYDKSIGDYIFNVLSTADGDETINNYVE